MFALVTWFYAIFCSKFLSVLFYALFPTMISVLKASRKQANNLRPVWFVYLAFSINQFMNMEGKTLLEEGEISEIWRGEKHGCVNVKLLWMENSSFDLSIKKGGRFLPAGKCQNFWSFTILPPYQYYINKLGTLSNKKNDIIWEFFPNVGPPPPFGNPLS